MKSLVSLFAIRGAIEHFLAKTFEIQPFLLSTIFAFSYSNFITGKEMRKILY